jgi:hypothetical protein
MELNVQKTIASASNALRLKSTDFAKYSSQIGTFSVDAVLLET